MTTLFAFSIPLALYYAYEVAVPLVILATLYGFRWKVGMWGNVLSLGAVLLSFLIAVGWWESLAYFLAQQAPAMLFVVDCVAFFTIFLVALLILDFATRYMSTVKVKYPDMVEKIGNGVVLLLLTMALCGIYTFGADDLAAVGARHDASPNKRSVMPIAALRILSAGNLSGFTQVHQFDSRGDFQELHLQRRQLLMLNMLENGDEGPIRGIQGSETYLGKIKWRE